MSYLETARRILEARRSRNRPDSDEPCERAKEAKEAKEVPPTIPGPRPEPAPQRWTPQDRLIADARRLGVRLVVDGQKVHAIRPDAVSDHDWDALRFGLVEFEPEVVALLAFTADDAPAWTFDDALTVSLETIRIQIAEAQAHGHA